MIKEEILSIKLLKLKDRRGDQIIQTFCKIGSHQKLRPTPSLICRNFKALRKVRLNHAKCIEKWMTMNLGPWNFKIEIQMEGPNNSEFLQNWFALEIRPPSLSCRNFENLQKVLLNRGDALKSNEWQRNCVHQTFKIQMQMGELNNKDFLQNRFPSEIWYPTG